MAEAIITELDRLIMLLESTIPANPNSVENQKLAKDLEETMRRYFSSLEDALPADKLEQLYYVHVEQ